MLSSKAVFLLFASLPRKRSTFACYSTRFLRNNDHIVLISGLHKDAVKRDLFSK